MSLISLHVKDMPHPKLTCEEQCFDDTILLVRERGRLLDITRWMG